MLKKNINNKLTYISLFSSAGIGCFGFLNSGFECVATSEILEKRLNIQKANKKCKYDSGYISGDITEKNTQDKILFEIDRWNKKGDIDVVIATPPCQGMSVANQKKNIKDIKRNSLVVEAIQMVLKIYPKIFIFENVRSFLKTICTGIDGNEWTIKEEIEHKLGELYTFHFEVINFKDYGSNSSRTRTLVVGVRKNFIETIMPFEILPNFIKGKTLTETIGKYKPLTEMGEFDKSNLLHHFKPYDKRMTSWIKDLKEGDSAFDNKNDLKKPHKITNNEIVPYVRGFGDKYKRQFWDKVGQCVHTANDCLASQNTIHPKDNRVFSIAELMEMMSIPKNFKWDIINYENLSLPEKKEWIKKNQSNIRKCIGEAVPTAVFKSMAVNIREKLEGGKDLLSLSNEFEFNNARREKDSAFYTTRINLNQIYESLPSFSKNEIHILEPSVGAGNFLVPVFKKYADIPIVNLTLIDINPNAIDFLKSTLKKIEVPKNFKIVFLTNDFLLIDFDKKFDLIIGNPPFKKIKIKNDKSKNLFELFWLKSFDLGENIIFINPKFLISSNVYSEFRKVLSKKNISNIIDFGEMGFKGVKIETIAIIITDKKQRIINVVSVTKNLLIKQNKKYIFDEKLPHWILYRNSEFDYVYNKMTKDIFDIFKNYEISNSILSKNSFKNSIWILRSKNINFISPKIDHIENYDRFAEKSLVEKTSFYKKILSIDEKLYLIPTLTYYPRIIEMPNDVFINGSILIAKLKNKEIKISNQDIIYFYSNEFRIFYSIAFNYSRRTLNIDSNTIKFFGVVR